jgi:hypothetical protein
MPMFRSTFVAIIELILELMATDRGGDLDLQGLWVWISCVIHIGKSFPKRHKFPLFSHLFERKNLALAESISVMEKNCKPLRSLSLRSPRY